MYCITWFGHEARETPADGVTLGVGGAGGAGAAGAGLAGVGPFYTALVAAHEAVLAVGVHHALGPATWHKQSPELSPLSF